MNKLQPTDNITIPLRIQKVRNLNEWDKLKVYLHYQCSNLSLKHNFEVVDKLKPNWQHGYGDMDKEHLGIGIRYLWKNTPIQDFESFISDANIDVRDRGEDWEKNGFAKRRSIEYYGIYDWYWKNESFFNL